MMGVLQYLNESLRGKSLLDLVPFLPDPTESQREREAYIKFVVPIGVFFGVAVTAPFYGFNVWLLPLTIKFYGASALYTMSNGSILYAFSSAAVSACLTMALSASKLPILSSGLCIFVGTTLYAVGLALTGISNARGSEIGMFLTQFFLCGPGAGLCMFVAQMNCVMWFREIDRPALGAGITGFFFGIWPATFSFWGTALQRKAAADGDDFIYSAIIVALVQVPAVFLVRSPTDLPLSLPQPNGTNAHEAPTPTQGVELERRSTDRPTASEANNNRPGEDNGDRGGGDGGGDDEEENEVAEDGGRRDSQPPLSSRDLCCHPQIAVQFVVWFLTLAPGFGVKFTVAPLISSIFGGSQGVQVAASFLFLFTYSISRLSVGLAVGTCLTLTTIMIVVTGIQAPAFFFTGSIVKTGKTETLWMWLFIVGMMAVGCGLAACKVCIPLITLDNWGVQNLARVSARMQVSCGLAAFAGPLWIWYSLSRPGDLYIDPSSNTSMNAQLELQHYLGNSILLFGGISCLAVVGHCLCDRKVQIKDE